METSLSNRIKKLIYQSWHRGCKETDMILGDFAKEKIAKFSESKLDLYETMISENDWDIYGWFVGKYDIPEKYCGMIKEIKDFCQQKVAKNK
jgi:antitoxin CptB